MHGAGRDQWDAISLATGRLFIDDIAPPTLSVPDPREAQNIAYSAFESLAAC
jgi:tRNA U54 and U55 pseudouridine synthase Pus10